MKHTFSLLLVAGLMVGCLHEAPTESDPGGPKHALTNETDSRVGGNGGGPTSRPSGESVAKAPGGEFEAGDYDHFGAAIEPQGDAMTLAAVAGKVADLGGKKVRLAGQVQSVCKSKGCWMVLSDGEQSVRVTFRGYGFFVPKDCEGREAVLEGTFSCSETSVAELKHLLEDEGKLEEAAKVTKPQLEMKIEADGVALRKKG